MFPDCKNFNYGNWRLFRFCQSNWELFFLQVHIQLSLNFVWLLPDSRAPKKNTSHGNEVLPQDTSHLIQRPFYQRGNPCQDPAGNRSTRRPPDDRKETQTVLLWSCVRFIRSGQNHFARHSERGKKTRQTEEEMGRQHQGIDRPGVRLVPEYSGEQGKMEETGCEIIWWDVFEYLFHLQ